MKKSEAMAYLLDTNIFIESKNRMPIDLWPTFWTRMSQMVSSGNVFSISKVKEEIYKGKDELVDWIKNNAPIGFFIVEDADVMACYAQTQAWAQRCSVGFKESALADYADNADGYLVATAAAKNMVVVTHENSDPTSRKRVKIPDACQPMGVRTCGFNDFLREIGVTI